MINFIDQSFIDGNSNRATFRRKSVILTDNPNDYLLLFCRSDNSEMKSSITAMMSWWSVVLKVTPLRGPFTAMMSWLSGVFYDSYTAARPLYCDVLLYKTCKKSTLSIKCLHMMYVAQCLQTIDILDIIDAVAPQQSCWQQILKIWSE